MINGADHPRTIRSSPDGAAAQRKDRDRTRLLKPQGPRGARKALTVRDRWPPGGDSRGGSIGFAQLDIFLPYAPWCRGARQRAVLLSSASPIEVPSNAPSAADQPDSRRRAALRGECDLAEAPFVISLASRSAEATIDARVEEATIGRLEVLAGSNSFLARTEPQLRRLEHRRDQPLQLIGGLDLLLHLGTGRVESIGSDELVTPCINRRVARR